jgi:hypothetical protein
MNYLQQKQDIQLLPGKKNAFEHLFKTNQEYEEFCKEYYNSVIPVLKENARKRAKSELELMSKIIC